MRRLSLNLLTSSVTLLMLGALTIPAIRIFTSPVESTATVTQASDLRRVFGVYVDPWHVDDWTRDVGAAPQLVAKFEAFSRRPAIDSYLRETERRGIRRVMVSWEPWRPVPAALGLHAQQRQQPGYRNADIAAGSQDSYIRRFAQSLAKFRGLVYLRYAHEMNGFWYPWSRDAPGYVRAWRRIAHIFHRAGAENVRFVWSVNPNLYQDRGERLKNMRRYWPGRRYVDAVGSTMINFGGQKNYSVARLYGSLSTLRLAFHKPVILTETNTERRGRVHWLRDLRSMLRRTRWIRAVAWSQLPSRGKVQRRNQIGDTNWDVTADPAAAGVLRAIIEDGSR
jgi:mannan endo-1,4-beta-mannosidase